MKEYVKNAFKYPFGVFVFLSILCFGVCWADNDYQFMIPALKFIFVISFILCLSFLFFQRLE
jgi:hypothetical protein